MRPYIICHMTTSIDGRLHPSRFTQAAAGVSADVFRRHYEKIYQGFEADGWIVGRKTMSEMAKGTERSIAEAPKVPREAHIAERKVASSPSLLTHQAVFITAKTMSAAITSLRYLVRKLLTPISPSFAKMAFRMSSLARKAMICQGLWNNSPLFSAS